MERKELATRNQRVGDKGEKENDVEQPGGRFYKLGLNLKGIITRCEKPRVRSSGSKNRARSSGSNQAFESA